MPDKSSAPENFQAQLLAGLKLVSGPPPLRLVPHGMWDPEEEYWGEPGDPLPEWTRAIIACGPRAMFEMEQIIPGLAQDRRCLDAHAHLGNLTFDRQPRVAFSHYQEGVSIGDVSVGEHFEGVLPWGLIDNRPFLRCLSGYGLCLWRMGRLEEAARVFGRLLWLNPSDNQGVRFLLDDIARGRPWRPDPAEGSKDPTHLLAPRSRL